jgi:hypothetical protein
VHTPNLNYLLEPSLIIGVLGLKVPFFRFLLVLSLALLLASTLLPWLSVSYTLPWAIYPPPRLRGEFWSFHAEYFSVYADNKQIYAFWFQQVWSGPVFYGMMPRDPTLYVGWAFIFIFQTFAIIAVIWAVLRSKWKHNLLLLSGALVASACTLILGYYQILRYSALGDPIFGPMGGMGLTVTPEIGPFVAILGVAALSLASVTFAKKAMKE